MSNDRSSSAVRNLRSIFENKATESSPNARGRSPANLNADVDGRQNRPRSRVRASFVAVGPTMSEESSHLDGGSTLERISSAERRRGSFDAGKSGSMIDSMKATVHDEQLRRNLDSNAAETILEAAVESAAATPLIEPGPAEVALTANPFTKPAEHVEVPASNPDKSVTGAEEEPADMQPADPKSEEDVSGGAALLPVAEDLRPGIREGENEALVTSASRPKSKANRPTAISTQEASKAASSTAKSPASLPKTPKTTTNGLTKKASRSSLTAPTAASVARAAAADKSAPAAKKGPSIPPLPKSRDITKPANVSAHLTAPTAASRAKHESSATAPANGRTSVVSRPKPQTTSAKPTPRSSLAGRPESRTSQAPSKKVPPPVDGNFLERMMRPTAASSNKAHEKAETKTPPRQKPALPKPKASGHSKAAKPALKKSSADPAEPQLDEGHVGEPSVLDEGESTATATDEKAAEVFTKEAVADEQTGNETPISHMNGDQDHAVMEATPAAIGGEEHIR